MYHHVDVNSHTIRTCKEREAIHRRASIAALLCVCVFLFVYLSGTHTYTCTKVKAAEGVTSETSHEN